MNRIISQYAASKAAGVTRQAMYKQSRLVPLPGYFINTVNGLKVNPDHPEFKLYCQKQKARRKEILIIPNDAYRVMGKAVVSTLQEKLDIDRETLSEILNEMDRKLKPFRERQEVEAE